MSIANVSASVSAAVTTAPTSTGNVSESAATTTVAASDESTAAAIYEPSTPSKDDNKIDAAKVKQMIDESNQKAKDLAEMIRKLINKQAKTNAAAQGKTGDKDISDAFDSIMNKIYNGENVMVEVDAETRAQAQKDIEEGGYYSVEKTGDRILAFADAFSTSDPAKIEKMRDAFIKGYEQAEEMWGGKLPQISKDTYDYVMKGFDERLEKISAGQAGSAL